MATLHENLLNEILVRLTQKGILAWKNASGVGRSFTGNAIIRYGLVGSSDILAIRPPNGQLCAIEGKVGKDKQRPEQKNFQIAVEKRGGIYILARSVEDIEHL